MVPSYGENGNVTYTSLATNVRTPTKPTRPYVEIPNKPVEYVMTPKIPLNNQPQIRLPPLLNGKLPLISPKGLYYPPRSPPLSVSPPPSPQSTLTLNSPVSRTSKEEKEEEEEEDNFNPHSYLVPQEEQEPEEEVKPTAEKVQVDTMQRTKLLGLLKASQGVQHGATETYGELAKINETEGINAPSWRWKFQSADVTRSAMEEAVDSKINKLVRSIYGIDDVALNLKRRRDTRRRANKPPDWDAMYPINREDYRQILGIYKPQQKPSPYLTPGQQKPASGASTGLYGGARRKSTKATKARKVTNSKKSRRRVRK